MPMDEPMVRKSTPFDALLGLDVKQARDGESEVLLELVAAHCNRRGVAHGGVVCGLLDTALGAAVVSTPPRPSRGALRVAGVAWRLPRAKWSTPAIVW